jgi:hypothetical protein
MITTTCFAAKLLKSLYPKQIPVTASVWAYLYNSKKYTLPTNLPLCQLYMEATGKTLGAALHFWARMELVRFVQSQRCDNKAIHLFYNCHNLTFEDYDYESAVKNCQRNVKRSIESAHIYEVQVAQKLRTNTEYSVQFLLGAAYNVQKYCSSNGMNITHNFAAVWLLHVNTALNQKQIAAELRIVRRSVTNALTCLKYLRFPIPSHVLSPTIETS